MKKISSKNLPLISVIITTKNEEKNIKNCLESIKYQTYPQDKIEIIVVDNNSTDKTKEIAKKYTSRIFDKGPERSAQRNYGIKNAKGSYVLYLDADMILSPTIIERSLKKFEPISSIQHPVSDFPLVALYIPEIVLGNSYWSQVRRFERSFYDGTVVDCVRFIKKDIFEKTGGFDLSMTGPEDWDLDKKIRKIGKTGLLDKYSYAAIDNKLKEINYKDFDLVKKLQSLTNLALIYHNETEFNLKNYLRKKKYYGQSFGNYIQIWGKDDPDIRKQFGLWYRYIKVYWNINSYFRIINYPHLFLGMVFLRFLVGIQFLKGKFFPKELIAKE